jgi:O-antigen biosynthesis protein
MDEYLIKNYPIVDFLKAEQLDENTSEIKMLQFIGDNKRVVDFGCASGNFAQLLKEKGCTVTGVDINYEAAKIAEKYCEQVFVADLDFVLIAEIFANQKFDVAVFGDVLEHLRNPWKVLRDAQKILKECGYVVASIPNIAHGAIRLDLLQGNFDYSDFGILDNTHLRFFTRKTVQSLFEDSGYTLDAVERTKRPIFNGGLVPVVERESFSPELVHKIELEEEAETLQFILKAFPKFFSEELEAGKVEFERPKSQLQEIREEFARSQSQVLALETELGLSKSELRQMQAKLDLSKSELQQAQCEIQVHVANISAMQSSKFWKLRTVWLSLKRMIGMKTDG